MIEAIEYVICVRAVTKRNETNIIHYTQGRYAPSIYIGKRSRLPTIHAQIKPVTIATDCNNRRLTPNFQRQLQKIEGRIHNSKMTSLISIGQFHTTPKITKF